MSLELSLRTFDPERAGKPAFAMRVDMREQRSEVPVHQHRQGQLVLALRGGVTCEVPEAVWMVPPGCAVWIPWQMPHSVRATANARVCYLFVEPGAAALPAECCTLSITPMVREMILHLAGETGAYAGDSATGRLVGVLLDQLTRMRIERLHLPTSPEPRIRRIAAELADNPADRGTLADWAGRVAMSERSLARLVKKETGLTFGRWRRQLHLVVALRQLSAGATVQQVSGELGYESVTAFITMFRKSLGKTPGKYFAAAIGAGEA